MVPPKEDQSRRWTPGEETTRIMRDGMKTKKDESDVEDRRWTQRGSR